MTLEILNEFGRIQRLTMAHRWHDVALLYTETHTDTSQAQNATLFYSVF